MSYVHCPMTKTISPMSSCLICANHVKDGVSIQWCGYRIPEKPKDPNPQIPINALEMQMRKKLAKADYFYKTGKTRIADSLSEEAAQIERQIRRMKKDA
jgi:hypothetical protein